jgi:hypothetical protein
MKKTKPITGSIIRTNTQEMVLRGLRFSSTVKTTTNKILITYIPIIKGLTMLRIFCRLSM